MLSAPVRIIARNNLLAYGRANPRAAAPLTHWHEVVKAADWATMQDAAATFSKAKAIDADRLRFDIGGGDFRLVCAVDFKRRLVFVKFIGTHAEYDRVDARTVAQF